MRCVAEVGYSRATLREIARAAQMTSGSLYHYFPNKIELITAVFNEAAALVTPRLTVAARRGAGIRDKLLALLDEGERIQREYPYAAAFERAIRSDTQLLDLTRGADSLFTALHDEIVAIVKQAKREGALAPGASVQGAAAAVFVLIRGLSDYASSAPADQYGATVRSLKLLIDGSLFNYDKLS